MKTALCLTSARGWGEYLRKELKILQKECPGVIADIRGMGLLVGMELTRDGSSIVKACMEKGLLLNCTAGNVLRFTPPLIVHGRDTRQHD